MQCVVETKSFIGAASDCGISDEDRHKIVTFVAENPDAGDVIKGTGGARKIRFGHKNKGKSGGVRVVTYFDGEDIPVFLLDVFEKGDRINLSQAERNELRAILGDMAQHYRAANKAKLAQLQEKVG